MAKDRGCGKLRFRWLFAVSGQGNTLEHDKVVAGTVLFRIAESISHNPRCFTPPPQMNGSVAEKRGPILEILLFSVPC